MKQLLPGPQGVRHFVPIPSPGMRFN
jgi:hypothetical protein